MCMQSMCCMAALDICQDIHLWLPWFLKMLDIYAEAYIWVTLQELEF